jgi:thymidylate synthase
MKTNCVSDIRSELLNLYVQGKFVTDKYGGNVIELCGASFIADEPYIFGEVNYDYIKRELDWYNSQSLFVKDLGDPVPKIWQSVSSQEGKINSNYGYLIFSKENFNQYNNVVDQLIADPSSRRSVMVYNRPSIHVDYCEDGMSDFICTNAVQYMIRDNRLNVVVQMRSNDAWAGYRNDYAWQKYVQERVVSEYNERTNHHIIAGNIVWQVGSLHLYSRQFYLLDAELQNQIS